MNINPVCYYEVTLPDGSKAFFEKRETAERICKVVDMLSDIALEARADVLEAQKREAKKPAKTAAKEKAAPKAKPAKQSKKPEAKPCAEKKPASTNARGYVYAERECGVCGNKFSPRSGRQKVCETCRKQGWKTCKSADEAVAKTDAKTVAKRPDPLADVRKLAREAHLGPYGEGKKE